MSYDWTAGLVFFVTVVAVTRLGTFLAFKIPAFVEMRELNREQDKIKLERAKVPPVVKQSQMVGLGTNLFFLIAVFPFFFSLDAKPLWRHGVEIFAVLYVFDFFYYLTHRFLFHGKILRKVHSLHHEARKPTYIDALYVHPLETFIGLFLFLGSIPLVALVAGPLHPISMAIATIVFTSLNTINHIYINLPFFPYKTLDRITSIHAAHHVDMNRGNYATLTMIYDRLFGTFEQPVARDHA